MVWHAVNTEVRFMFQLYGLPWSCCSVFRSSLISIRKDLRFLLVQAIAVSLNLSI